MEPEHHFPLPERQYRWYIVFFLMLMLAALAGALMWLVWNRRAVWGWRETVVSVLLLVQIGLFLGIMVLAREWPLSRRRLGLYFAVSLGIWLVEYWLVPDVYWIVFAYLGQMFGLLPARFGFIVAILVSILIFGGGSGWDLSNIDSGMLISMAAVWASFLFLVYISHLTQASQERGTLIAELEAAKQELQAAQQREAELAVLRERERLARDLHDSLGHTLVTLSVQMEAIQRLYRVDPEQASAQLDEMKELTRSSMDSLRRSLAGLRAPGLGDSTLRPALQALCLDFGQRTGLEVTCRIDEGADALRPPLAEALWRITQEALTNIEKHALARRARVTLSCEPSSVILQVTDDGVGLSPGAEATSNRFGLRGMRERAEGLGGRLMLQGDENGTTVEAYLPVITAG